MIPIGCGVSVVNPMVTGRDTSVGKRNVTSCYHGSKKFLDLNNLDRDHHLHCRMMEGKCGLLFCSEAKHALESHTCQFSFTFFFAIFAGPQFVEIQKFCYHSNVM